MDNRSRLIASGLTLLALTLNACSWADFKEFGYEVAKDSDCQARLRDAPPGQRVVSVPDCYPPGDPRGMTAGEYHAERNRVLGIKEPEGDHGRIKVFGKDEAEEQPATAAETDAETN